MFQLQSARVADHIVSRVQLVLALVKTRADGCFFCELGFRKCTEPSFKQKGCKRHGMYRQVRLDIIAIENK